jgi:LuxR family maltose regulon positive regulatory protein
VNTVKTHIRSIYGKLSVSSRRDAVLRARQRGLLP